MRPVLIIVVILGACAVVGAFGSAKSDPPQLPNIALAPAGDPDVPYGVGKAPFAHRPATSCAAASCHGGGQVGKVGSEHTTWAPEAFPEGASDPHTRAYRVLFNPVSVEMAKKLKIGDAHKAGLCLKCHAVESATEPETRDQILSEGVGCGACHGPADKWIKEHYTAEWKGLSRREKWEKYGFVPAGNLVARTLNCAGCHSGDSTRDVNHDLYAAGHPRLAFEAARMHFQPDYRKHWTEKTPQPDFEVRLWVAGQAAALRCATDLLRARAERADKTEGIWPEFAGLSCYSCHQKVGEADLRGVASTGPRPAGVPGWEVWSNTAVEIAVKTCGEAYPGLPSPDLSAVVELRKLMESRRPPPARKVVESSTRALTQLDAWLVAMQDADDHNPKPVPKGTAQRLAHALAGNALAKDMMGVSKLKDHDWDALAANYLGCAAMFHATGGAPANKWGGELTALRDGLRFPPVLGAKNARDERFDSPAGFDLKKLNDIRMNFERLRDATAPTGGN